MNIIITQSCFFSYVVLEFFAKLEFGYRGRHVENGDCGRTTGALRV